ncbi:MAG: sigma 54-interacting transcriptional regulator [Kofleriaceae bacterium]|nr:sigma 54-interacting transcriptional regulator [Kofleriaceae bacterium]
MTPWWTDLDLPVLRYVRAVLHARKMDLVLTERAVAHDGAVLRVLIECGGNAIGSLCAVPWSAAPVVIPPMEQAVLEAVMQPAALDIAQLLASRSDGACDPTEPPKNQPRRASRDGYDALTGNSPEMQALYGMIDRLAVADSTVLIQGENGTGKELVARAIHHRSPRVNRRFVGTNCSAFNDNLLDSELFGHKRGAFTGAVVDKPGLFEVADGGTFFLDEIGDMSPTLQVKVLRVLQEGTFNRVGDTDTRKVDVRIICATNRDLAAMVEHGTFREDLYYRINVINVMLPALRERRTDIPMLVDNFMRKHARLDGDDSRPKRLAPECSVRLLAYPWPGNVRELENEIERLLVLSGDAAEIDADLLSPRIRDYAAVAASEQLEAPKTLPEAVERLERKMIAEALVALRGNKTRAAQALGVSRRNLIRLCQKYQLDDSE